jgi:hypothetical protein
VDSVDERQPMRRNNGLREGGVSRPGKQTTGVAPLGLEHVLPKLAQTYGMGWRHATRLNPN